MHLLRNPVYILLILVQVAWRYEYGNSVFIVKYFSMQFNLADWEAGAILGTGATIGSVVSAFGIFIGGWLVYRYKPTFSQATFGCAVLYFAMAMLTVGDMFIGCDNFELYGLKHGPSQSKLQTSCNIGCSCNTFAYTPVCDNGITYFSPCHAGCMDVTTNATKIFLGCSCTTSGTAIHGACAKTCSSYYIYVALEILKALIDGCTWSAVILILLRCVDSTEKALALGLRSFLASILGIPVALLYGAVMDSACLVWQETFRQGNSRGVCWVYDFQLFRLRFWGIPLGFRLFEVAIEVAILLYTMNKDIPMYDVAESNSDGNRRKSPAGATEMNEYKYGVPESEIVT